MSDEPPTDHPPDDHPRRREDAPPVERDRVDEAVEGTFPASDPPGWEPLRTGPPVRDDGLAPG